MLRPVLRAAGVGRQCITAMCWLQLQQRLGKVPAVLWSQHWANCSGCRLGIRCCGSQDATAVQRDGGPLHRDRCRAAGRSGPAAASTLHVLPGVQQPRRLPQLELLRQRALHAAGGVLPQLGHGCRRVWLCRGGHGRRRRCPFLGMHLAFTHPHSLLPPSSTNADLHFMGNTPAPPSPPPPPPSPRPHPPLDATIPPGDACILYTGAQAPLQLLPATTPCACFLRCRDDEGCGWRKHCAAGLRRSDCKDSPLVRYSAANPCPSPPPPPSPTTVRGFWGTVPAAGRHGDCGFAGARGTLDPLLLG